MPSPWESTAFRPGIEDLVSVRVPTQVAHFPGCVVTLRTGDTRHMSRMDIEFEGPVVEWRGPAPFYFVAISEEESAEIKFAAQGVEYWGQVPVVVSISDIEFTTALFPKDGRYLLPLKEAVRRSAGIEVDQELTVALSVGRQ